MPPVKDVFRRHGLRCTRQRGVIYEALRATKSHPTADELHESVCSLEAGISLATVYNTLEALTDHGLARRIPSPRGNGPSRYDADTQRHLHLTLPDGRIVDLPDSLAKPILDALPDDFAHRVSDLTGVDIGAVQIELTATPRRS